jgi:hypothetical protein
MATLGELRGKILRILDTATDSDAYSDDLVYDAIDAGYVAILPWVPKTVVDVSTITGDGSTTEFVLPTALFEVQALVVQETGEVLPRGILAPGSYHGENIDATNDWILFPSGSISFSKPLDSGDVYELWYTSFWTMPADMETLSVTLEVPQSVITGLTYYCAAYALMPAAVGAAELRQFGTRPDTGTPEHNPVRDAVTYLMSSFQREMNRLPEFQGMQT